MQLQAVYAGDSNTSTAGVYWKPRVAFEQPDSMGGSKFQGIVKMYNLRSMECEGTFFGHEGRVRSHDGIQTLVGPRCTS